MEHARRRDNPCLLTAALLPVVLLAVDASARVPGMVAQVVPFARRDDAVRLRRNFVPVQARLLAREMSSLGDGELAGTHALVDARALVLLRVVEGRGLARGGEGGHCEGGGEDECLP
jgi:hypothetical protein